MTLILTGAFLAMLSTLIVITINNKQALLAGSISALTVYLNLMAIVKVVNGADGLLFALGMGIGTAGTVYWNKRKV